MSTERWKLLSGFLALALAGSIIYILGANGKKQFTFPCGTQASLVKIQFPSNALPATNSGTLVCKGDQLKWISDAKFTIQFENTACFNAQTYPSQPAGGGWETTPTPGIRNPTPWWIGECKYSIIDAGGHLHDPHVIIMN